MLYATTVTTADELEQIHKLNQQNLKSNLSGEEKKQQGFVTWLYTTQLLQQMHTIAPSIIVKDGDRVAGYALVLMKEAGVFHPDLQAMLQHFQNFNYSGKPLTDYSFYVMGQICIHPDYRGKGVFELLYQKHKEIYSTHYQLLVTEISTSNYRSQKAHERVGFKTIYTYKDTIDNWNVVVWEW